MVVSRLGLSAVALCCLSVAGARTPPPAPATSAALLGEWREAQKDVSRLEPPVDGDPFQVQPNQFEIQMEEEPFYCGKTGLQAVLRVYGCFRAEPESDASERLGVIRYDSQKTGALRHEARHAILFALGDTRWPDVGH